MLLNTSVTSVGFKNMLCVLLKYTSGILETLIFGFFKLLTTLLPTLEKNWLK